jgi:hypothetical protein
MKSLMLVACAALVVLFPLRAAAQDATHVADSPKVTITVENPTLVGTTVLKPGEYKFQCRHVDGKSFLVVTDTSSAKEIVRVPCTQETLKEKVADSQLRSILQPDGSRKLQSVRIKGETIGHTVVN